MSLVLLSGAPDRTVISCLGSSPFELSTPLKTADGLANKLHDCIRLTNYTVDDARLDCDILLAF